MTLIDFGDFKLRFDPKEVRISIDGEIIDVGARRTEDPKTVDLYDAMKNRRRFVKSMKKSNQK